MEKAPRRNEEAHADENPFSNGVLDNVPEVTSLKGGEDDKGGVDVVSYEKAKHLLMEIESTK